LGLLKLAQARQRFPKGEDEAFHFFAEEIEVRGYSLAAIDKGIRSLWAIPFDMVNEFPALDTVLRAIANSEDKLRVRLPLDPASQFRMACTFRDNLQFFLERGFGTEEDYCAKWPDEASVWRTWPRDSADEATEPGRMTPREALDFLQTLADDILGRIEALREEHAELDKPE
jgi:hypothetical protein